MIEKRKRLAWALIDCSAELKDWSEKHSIELTPYDHASIYFEPDEAAEDDLQIIQEFEPRC